MELELKVKKRDGRIVDFECEKIANAITKAFVEVFPEKDYNELRSVAWERTGDIAKFILGEVKRGEITSPVNIEDIQDWVENCLMDFDKAIAKAFIKERFYKEIRHRIFHILVDSEVSV